MPIPLPAALVDTSFSLIQVGLKTLVLSTVIDKVEVQIPEFHEALEGAYSVRTAHPFRRNGAPFRFKLSKAQQVD